ncbi:MAG: ABC transporter permease [Planctomycetota bacterium]
MLGFLRSRGVRKFRRDRLAMVALTIIASYLTVAVLLLLGLVVDKDETFERVGPNSLVGFLEEPDIEKRLIYLEFYLDEVYSAADGRNPEAELAAIDLYGRVPVSSDPDELIDRIDPLWETYDELIELYEEDEHTEVADFEERLAQLEQEAEALYTEPDGLLGRLALSLGTDRQGRSIFLRALYSIKVAVKIGLVCALVAVILGSILGGAAAFFGGVVDNVIVWLYSTFSAIPSIVLLMVLAAMFLGSKYEGTLVPVYTALCLTYWIAPCRVIRGEVIKLRELEYVQAATAVGYGRGRILLRHILPNTAHLMFINFSLYFIGAIKSEVILSFLNLGVKNEPSWGVMIQQAKQEVISGFFWQIGAATAFMFVLVLAFNILTDALQDAFDPKHV